MTGLLLGVLMVTGYVLPGFAADGTPVGPGVAACPQRLAFGSALVIEGVGRVICHDRTPGNPELIDVWVRDVPAANAITGPRRVWLETSTQEEPA